MARQDKDIRINQGNRVEWCPELAEGLEHEVPVEKFCIQHPRPLYLTACLLSFCQECRIPGEQAAIMFEKASLAVSTNQVQKNFVHSIAM